MIVFLRGTIYELGRGYVDVDIQGVGYRALMTERDISRLAPQQDVFVYTHHHVREDDEGLYGFLEQADKEWFNLLISVTGIGPKGAIQIISASRFEDFAAAIRREDVPSLAKLPGIGKKTAERLVLELKDKIHMPVGGRDEFPVPLEPTSTPSRASSGRLSALDSDIVEALLSLGYNERQAIEAVTAQVMGQEVMSVEEGIRRCLTHFHQNRLSRRMS